MTKIKICGLSRLCDIEAANELNLDYIGFVFAPKSKRYVTFEQAAELKKHLKQSIKAVGVFVDEPVENIVKAINSHSIDIVQLHGNEDESYIKLLRSFIKNPIIKAFCVKCEADIKNANQSSADFILLDSGKGSGNVFDWNLIKKINCPYFLAGGISAENAETAIKTLNPYALDISSGVETDGLKDKEKMAQFVDAVRKEDKNDE